MDIKPNTMTPIDKYIQDQAKANYPTPKYTKLQHVVDQSPFFRHAFTAGAELMLGHMGKFAEWYMTESICNYINGIENPTKEQLLAEYFSTIKP
jgi:hypothetical protein